MTQLLLIEDNKSRRNDILQTLEMTQYKVDTAGSIKSCVKKALANKPQLILFNAAMQANTAHEIEQAIDHHPLLQSIPFLFFSQGKDLNNKLRQSTNNGFL